MVLDMKLSVPESYIHNKKQKRKSDAGKIEGRGTKSARVDETEPESKQEGNLEEKNTRMWPCG